MRNIDVLKCLGILEQFEKNCIEDQENFDYDEHNWFLYSEVDFREFVSTSFTWDASKEGHSYWQKISEIDVKRIERKVKLKRVLK